MAMNGHEVSWGSGWNHGLLKGLRVGGPGLGMCEKISVRAGWCLGKWGGLVWKRPECGHGLKTHSGKSSCEENLYSRLGGMGFGRGSAPVDKALTTVAGGAESIFSVSGSS